MEQKKVADIIGPHGKIEDYLPKVGSRPEEVSGTYDFVPIWRHRESSRLNLPSGTFVANSRDKPPIRIVYRWVRYMYFYMEGDRIVHTEFRPQTTNMKKIACYKFFTVPSDEERLPAIHESREWDLSIEADAMSCEENISFDAAMSKVRLRACDRALRVIEGELDRVALISASGDMDEYEKCIKHFVSFARTACKEYNELKKIEDRKAALNAAEAARKRARESLNP